MKIHITGDLYHYILYIIYHYAYWYIQNRFGNRLACCPLLQVGAYIDILCRVGVYLCKLYYILYEHKVRRLESNNIKNKDHCHDCGGIPTNIIVFTITRCRVTVKLTRHSSIRPTLYISYIILYYIIPI